MHSHGIGSFMLRELQRQYFPEGTFSRWEINALVTAISKVRENYTYVPIK